MDGITYQVNSTVYRGLTYGDEIIKQVKELLWRGSANQRATYSTQTAASLVAGRKYKRIMVDNIVHGHGGHHVRPTAVSALVSRAGNCGEQAAVAYCIARELPLRADICFVSCATMDHAFVTIGHPNRLHSDQVVVIDPWPINAQAVLLRQHFCYGRGYNVKVAAPAGKSGNFSGMRDKYEPTLPMWLAVRDAGVSQDELPRGAPYDQRYCSEDGIVEYEPY